MTQNERTAKANITAWKRSEYRNIWQAYERPSYNKEKAWHRCEEIAHSMGGYNLKVVSKNTFVFTAGFESVDPETGVLLYTHITPCYTTTVEQ